MLVYANELDIVGANPALQVLRAVSGWLSEKLDQRFVIRDITKPGEFSGGSPRGWVRIDRASGEGFALYSWIMKHPDATVRGRQWVTELGLKDDESGGAHFSCVVYTEEQSILVSDPVQASRPRVVNFVINNVEKEDGVAFAPGSIGSLLKSVGEDTDSYRGLLANIDDKARSYPLVLVSPDNDGRYYIDPRRLQKALFGLAQVVAIDPGFNSYEMSDVIGKEYSAWAGALNIIRTPHRDGRVFSQFILPRDFPIEADTAHKKECFVLGQVSHNTNIPRQKNRVRPEGVRVLAAKQRLQRRIAELSEKPDDSLREELGLVYEELEDLSAQMQQAQQEKDSLELTLLEREEAIQDLERKARESAYFQSQKSDPQDATTAGESIPLDLLEIASNNRSPSPEQCLNVLAKLYPRRLVVLPSAVQSAQEASGFAQGRRLLDMLNRLVTDYLPEYLSGGDVQARSTFTNNEFAATESDTVAKNRKYRSYRIFEFEGKEIEMLKHLKVGVADDPNSTIRVHFEVDQSSQRIIVGHCGSHLPLPGR